MADPLTWTILDPIVCCKEELQFFLLKLAIRQPIQQKKRRSQPDSHGRTDKDQSDDTETMSDCGLQHVWSSSDGHAMSRAADFSALFSLFEALTLRNF